MKVRTPKAAPRATKRGATHNTALPVVLDTAALLYWTLDPDALSPAASRAIDAAATGPGLLVSAISIWEIGLKAKRGQLSLGLPFEQFVERLERAEGIVLVPVDSRIWMRSLELDWKHRDPADRAIVATASLAGCALVTSDRAIRAFYSQAIW